MSVNTGDAEQALIETQDKHIEELEAQVAAPEDNGIEELDALCAMYNRKEIDITGLVCRIWNNQQAKVAATLKKLNHVQLNSRIKTTRIEELEAQEAMSDLVERLQDPMQFTWDMRLESSARIEELEVKVAALTGQLQNCVNHLDRAKRRGYTGNYDECIESANRALSKAALKGDKT